MERNQKSINDTFIEDDNRKKYQIVFPNIEKWVQSHGLSRKAFSDLLNRSYSNDIYWMTGKGYPSFLTIKCVLEVTGMTFEEAFKE